MAHEENSQKNSNSSSGGGISGGGGGISGGGGCSRSHKKMKQKKVPQRGLGVAQLEKIRIEEQQKKKESSTTLSPNPMISSSSSSSGLGVQCPTTTTFRPTTISTSSSVPLFSPPSPNDVPSIPNVDFLGPDSVPFSKSLNVSGCGGGGIGWGAVPGQGHGNWPRMWNSEYNFERENNMRQLDHHRFSLPSDLNLGCESTSPFFRLPNFPHHFQQSSLMNVSTGISSPPVINFNIEPPSNQNFSASNYTPLWPDEEKMIGMKRPYPFSMETPPAPAFHLKYHPGYGAPNPISRMDESASYSNRGPVSTDLGSISNYRGIPAKTGIVSQPPQEKVKENRGVLNGDFLSLGPPAATGSRQQISSRYNNNASAVSGHQRQGLFEFGSQSSREGNEDNFPEKKCSKSTRTSFFSFMPPATNPVDQNASLVNNCNGEVGENVDLSLKL